MAEVSLDSFSFLFPVSFHFFSLYHSKFESFISPVGAECVAPVSTAKLMSRVLVVRSALQNLPKSLLIGGNLRN